MATTHTPSFIETQFPVSRLSKESYKERKSNYSQTLTGLGKWWGRKPLILVRATILGLLMPASKDPERDRSIFLKILTMDREGLLRRWTKRYSISELGVLATKSERAEWNELDGALEAAKEKVKQLRNDSRQIERGDKEAKEAARAEIQEASEERDRCVRLLEEFIDALQERVFLRQPYEDQIARCDRPEQIDGPSEGAWREINEHLGTSASCLPELVRELGIKRFGHTPRVGDAFCGGGSIPFEAARIGCEAYGSDLNPVAALLTWAALNIVGGGEEVAEKVRAAQEEIYDAVDRQVTAWGIEHRTQMLPDEEWQELVVKLETGETSPAEIAHKVWRADAYLYCAEVTCPETGWRVPLAPSWVIGEKSKCIAVLLPDHEAKRYRIEIKSDVSEAEMKAAKSGTVEKGYIIHPILKEMGRDPASIEQARILGRGKDPKARYHKSGLRLWENDDVVPRPDDVFQERLYCVRWVETYLDKNGNPRTRKHYRSVEEADLQREIHALDLLQERFHDWQADGFIPSMMIEPGYNTDQPIRERGWTHWHQLFNPRQLLVLGSFTVESITPNRMLEQAVISLLGVMKSADHNSRLSGWSASMGKELVDHVFANQALNTLSNHGVRAVRHLESSYSLKPKIASVSGDSFIQPCDSRLVERENDFWVTDPPYADAVNYHELGDFFMCWIEGPLQKEFPGWYRDSKSALAVKGSDESFRDAMVDCYSRLGGHMPDDGQQVVMFTHQDASVWADLALILWSAGLRVTSAWCIGTETDSALKTGNYVQGTVLLILRKQQGEETAFLDEIYPEVEAEVRRQLDAMTDLDEKHATSPDFGDTDYQLAAYAAALRVLTRYRNIEDIDIAHELSKPRRKGGEKSPVEKVIDEAVKIACDHLVPKGFDGFIWKTLTPAERFYLKGLDLESHGEFRTGAYMELARGFGLRDYKSLLQSGKANETRLKTATGFGRKLLGDASDPFSTSLTRHCLFAVREVTAAEGDAERGRIWLRTEVPNYWSERKRLLEILRYLARLELTIPDWEQDGKSANTLAGAVENDSA